MTPSFNKNKTMAYEALASIGLGLGSTLYQGFQAQKNRDAQAGQNELDRQAQKKQWERERAAAIEDWDKNNSYNSPIQQMERLRQAGLNPNLVYGKGADNTAQMVRNTTTNMPNQIAPKFEAGFVNNSLNSIYLNKKISAETDNLHEQNALIRKQAILTDSQVAKTASETAMTGFELSKAQRLMDATVEKSLLENESKRAEIQQTIAATGKALADTQFTLDANQRAELKNPVEINEILIRNAHEQLKKVQTQAQTAETNQQIQNLHEQLNILESESQIKWIQEQLAQQGIMPGDAAYVRAYLMILNKLLK